MERAALLVELGAATPITLAQACIAGVLLNLATCFVALHLWRRDRTERYLAFWAVAHGFNALRWVLVYPAVTQGVIALQFATGLSAGAAITLSLVGAYSLLPQRRLSLGAAAAILACMFCLVAATGVRLAMLGQFFIAAAGVAWVLAGWLFWLAHRNNPLSAYLIAVGAMAVNIVIAATGYTMLGRAYSTSILLAINAVPSMIAFFLIAYQRALVKVRDSEETMQALFDTVPLPVVISRPPEGRVERINRAAIEVFGRSATEFIGHNGIESGVVGDLDARAWLYSELIAGRDVRNHEMTYIRGDGRPMQVSANASPVEIGGGTRFVLTLFDLTEHRRIEGALRDLNASREQQVADRTRDLESFNYSVSHDLRAPLRVIDGYSMMLEEELGDSLAGQARDHLARMRASVRRMNALIEAMIGLARHARAALLPVEIDLSEMARRVLDDLCAADPGRQVELRVEPALRTLADRESALIVLDNLLRNAWKYTSRTAQARIEFGAVAIAGQRMFFVRDNGAGFDMRYSGRLFMPFQRLHTAAEFEGTGIGLATVERIIRNHGGSVRGEGAVGAGATFTFSFGKDAGGAAAPAAGDQENAGQIPARRALNR